MLGSFNKQAFSMFTGRATPTQDAGKKNITAAVDVYVSDFGTLKAVPNLFMRTRDVLVLEMEKWALRLACRAATSFLCAGEEPATPTPRRCCANTRLRPVNEKAPAACSISPALKSSSSSTSGGP
jgi:hypothetical protein